MLSSVQRAPHSSASSVPGTVGFWPRQPAWTQTRGIGSRPCQEATRCWGSILSERLRAECRVLRPSRAVLVCGHARPLSLLTHTRRTVVIRMTLPATEKLVWQRGGHTVKLDSAS